MSVISCQLLVIRYQLSIVRYQLVLTSPAVGDTLLLLHSIYKVLLVVNKRHHNMENRVNCLIMHVVYLEGLLMVYRVVGFNMGNQGNLGYLFSCQGYARITAPH